MATSSTTQIRESTTSIKSSTLTLIGKNEVHGDLLEHLDSDTNIFQPTVKSATASPRRVAALRSFGRSSKSEKDKGYPFCPLAPTLERCAKGKSPRLDNTTAINKTSPLRHLALSAYSTATNIKMPHGLSMPQSGFQALILCGPGAGLNTFTSVPQEYPKALVTVANRPMVWYPLDWCYRMGVTDITLVTPPSSAQAIKTALAQNPHLTTLPSPSPDVLAPSDLDHTTPTAELLRLPEVQAAIKTDFILLPCDLICDIPGENFIESYFTSVGGLSGVGNVSEPYLGAYDTLSITSPDQHSGRRGGLSIWYNTSNRPESVKGEECDFMCTTSFRGRPKFATSRPSADDLRSQGTLRKLLWTMPMSELQDECDENKAWNIRYSLLQKHGVIKALTKYRDSHIYLLPLWVKDFARLNDDFETFSEDLIGTWAKFDSRKSKLRDRYHVRELFDSQQSKRKRRSFSDNNQDEETDLSRLSSTYKLVRASQQKHSDHHELHLASRVPADPDDSILSTEIGSDESTTLTETPRLPPIISCILPSGADCPLVRRVDTAPLLLSVSLHLAKVQSIEESPNIETSPFAHANKIATTASIAPKVTISRADTLIDSNATVATLSVLKSSVIGSNVTIGTGVRLTNCLIMDGAMIGDKSVLNGTIVGKRAKIGKNCTLNNCEVQDGNMVEDGTDGKGEKYLIGGLEDEMEDGDDFHVDGDDENDEGISLGEE